ncbi:MAG: ARMT1-like domain-containing protein, partial [Chloroflexi bacterium]|nr:ARMT1-like domain-containing protein [Chloroflexota bacterium]
MKAAIVCYECLKRLVIQASRSATNDPVLCEVAQKAGLVVLDKYFSTNIVTIEIATKIHQAVKDATGNPDPYRTMKDREIALSREWYNSGKPVSDNDMRACFEIAAKGNVIDFFRPFEQIKADLDRKVDFVINDFDQLENKLARAKTVLYLADNAGEVFFDLHFIRCLSRLARVTYVVKALPVQNDITVDDIKKAGLWDEFKGIE